VYDEQFDERSGAWGRFGPEPSFVTAVEEPQSKKCLGYDVVTFWAGAGPQCSPLSCNSLAQGIAVNPHCLFTSFDQAKKALDDGAFANTEPGPMRIFAVYNVG
jgi:hypothetical protein